MERRTDDGSWTLAQLRLGEACHSRSGAWKQAVERYAGGCRLAERSAGGHARLRLLDVGTGLGLNLAAALAALAPGSSLEVLSLELDPAVIERGLALYARLPAGPWEPWHGRVRRALTAALATPGRAVALEGGSLVLLLGDARATLAGAAGPFDAVFLDPFSPRRAPELWSPAFLAELARRMAPGSWLSTYSAAFAVRLALSAAGLRVGRGPRVGTKAEGTVASPDAEPPALPPRTARRLARRLRGLLAECARDPGAPFD
jgi:tRNA U34 5-methylaminomethyl-2-thiouridine-forming methyltransferase MnmC